MRTEMTINQGLSEFQEYAFPVRQASRIPSWYSAFLEKTIFVIIVAVTLRNKTHLSLEKSSLCARHGKRPSLFPARALPVQGRDIRGSAPSGQHCRKRHSVRTGRCVRRRRDNQQVLSIGVFFLGVYNVRHAVGTTHLVTEAVFAKTIR